MRFALIPWLFGACFLPLFGQIEGLRDAEGVGAKAGLGLAAISYDSAAVLREFAKRKSITFPLLSDHESTVIQE